MTADPSKRNVKSASANPTQPSEIAVSSILDRTAVFLSGVCVLHCLFVPVIITLLPIFSSNLFLEDLLFHRLMLFLVLPTSTIALFIGCRKHRDWLIISTGLLGLSMLIIITMFGHDFLNSTQEKITTSLAGIILATSHILNYRACQKLTCDDDNCGSDHHH